MAPTFRPAAVRDSAISLYWVRHEVAKKTTLHGCPRRLKCRSRMRGQPAPWLRKGHISVTVAASFVDSKLEQNITTFRLIRCRFGGNRAEFAIVQKSGSAPDEELTSASQCVGHAIVEGVPTSLAEVAPFGRGRLHEYKEPPTADNGHDRMNPRRANVSKGCQVGRAGGQALCAEPRQIGCLGMEVIPTGHDSHSVSSMIVRRSWSVPPLPLRAEVLCARG